jgi:hypothetical protein
MAMSAITGAKSSSSAADERILCIALVRHAQIIGSQREAIFLYRFTAAREITHEAFIESFASDSGISSASYRPAIRGNTV